MNRLFYNAAQNIVFVLEFFGIVVGIFLLAVCLEKISQKKKEQKEKIMNTRKAAMIGMFSAIAMIFMLFEFPVPFAPGFYELDFSELPVLIGAFAFGPSAGVLMEFIKILLKLFFKGTTTAFVGDFANFVIGCSFILPASAIYTFKKTKKSAVWSCMIGTISMTVFGTVFNAIYLIPAFSKLYGIPMTSILEMGSLINPFIKEENIVHFVMACVAPLNIIKGISISIVTLFIYKPLSPIIKANHK